MRCANCGTSEFVSADWAIEVPFTCPACDIVLCFQCACQISDGPGPKIALRCPQCSSQHVRLIEARETSPHGDAIRDAVLASLPDADVRTDQCDTVRVYWRTIVGAIRPHPDGGFQVIAVEPRTMPGPADPPTQPPFSKCFDDIAVAIDQLISALKSLDQST